MSQILRWVLFVLYSVVLINWIPCCLAFKVWGGFIFKVYILLLLRDWWSWHHWFTLPSSYNKLKRLPLSTEQACFISHHLYCPALAHSKSRHGEVEDNAAKWGVRIVLWMPLSTNQSLVINTINHGNHQSVKSHGLGWSECPGVQSRREKEGGGKAGKSDRKLLSFLKAHVSIFVLIYLLYF